MLAAERLSLPAIIAIREDGGRPVSLSLMLFLPVKTGLVCAHFRAPCSNVYALSVIAGANFLDNILSKLSLRPNAFWNMLHPSFPFGLAI